MVNLQWSQLAFLFFHHCSRDQAAVSTCGLDRKLLPLHRLQKSKGQGCRGGGRAVHQGPAVLPWSSQGFRGHRGDSFVSLRLTFSVCHKFSHEVLGTDVSVC